MDLRPKMPCQPVWYFIFEVDTEFTSYIECLDLVGCAFKLAAGQSDVGGGLFVGY